MVSTFTPFRHIELPARGDAPGTWDVPANGDFTIIDGCFGGVTSLSLSNLTVVLNTAQTQTFRIAISGTITANIQVRWPAASGGLWVVDNQAGSPGGFSITCVGSTLNGVTVPYGLRSLICISGGFATFATDGLIPPGSMVAYADNSGTAPPGWLLCDGSAYSPASFPNLFNVISTIYGSSGGNFRVPDYRGRALTGSDNMGTGAAGRLTSSMSSLFSGGSGGVQDITLGLTQIPAHSHGASTGANSAAHTHTYTSPASASIGVAGGSTFAVIGSSFTGTTSTSSSTSHSHSIASDGGGLSHSNVQPTLLSNVIIKY